MASYSKLTTNYNDSLLKIPKVGKVEPSNKVQEMGWYNALYSLSNGEYLNIPKVLKTPIDESLMFLLYKNRITYDEAETAKRVYK